MGWLWIVGVAIFIVAFYWLFRRQPRAATAATTLEITVRRPTLPTGREQAIVSALQRGEEPDEDWMRENLRGANGTLRMAAFSGCFQSVAGETFNNPDGQSRQTVLAKATPGQEAWLIPEPANRHDPNAVAVYLDFGGGNTGQIGYLPRDHNHGVDLAANKVVAWLAKVAAPRRGAPLGAVLYVVTINT